MDLFSDPVSFVEAVHHLASKNVLPTALDSAGLKQAYGSILRQSFTSAQTVFGDVLDEYKTFVESMINPQQVQREGSEQTVTEGMSFPKAQELTQKFIQGKGYKPEPGTKGTLQDLGSDARVKLVLNTNVQLAQGAGHFVQQNGDEDVVDLYPALELYRLRTPKGGEKAERDWDDRWDKAADSAGDVDAARVLEETGRMVALKSSGIWQALGDGAGGYDDTLGNPYPPFAFQSGMWTEDVSRDDAEELGLLDKGEAARPANFDLSTLFKEAA